MVDRVWGAIHMGDIGGLIIFNRDFWLEIIEKEVPPSKTKLTTPDRSHFFSW
jgi:hypothetical protein